MAGHKRKRCWLCAQKGIARTFKNRARMRAHIFENHPESEGYLTSFNPKKERGVPNVVHYGARMRKKLGLEYNKDGHLRSTLEVV